MKKLGNNLIIAIFFLLIIFCGIGGRLYHITAPLADHQEWRQCDTAAMAKNFYENNTSILYPQIDWGGNSSGYVESEFPLFPYIVSIIYRFTGTNSKYGRMLSILLYPLSSLLLFLTTSLIYDYYVAFASLFIFTFSPLSIYYYRAFMPESLLLFFIILSLFLIIKWQKERKTIFFNLSIFSFSIALLVKILVLFLLPVFLLIIYTSNNDKQKSFKNILLFTLLSLILPVCWHLHAYLIYKETGLTFGIFSGGFLKFGTMYDWSNWGFYEKIFKRIFILLLTPFGFILFLFGIFIKEEKKENLFLYLWLILLPIVVIATSKGFYAHDYYLISFLPMFSMIAGKSIRPLIPMIKKINSKVLITLFLFVILLPLSSYYALVGDMYIKGGLYKIKWNLIEMGKFIKENSDRNSLIAIAGTPDITPLPCLFYFSERKGWYLKKDDLKTEDDLKKIKADGASIVATMEVNEFPILKNYAQKKPNKVIRKNDFLIIIINEQE